MINNGDYFVNVCPTLTENEGRVNKSKQKIPGQITGSPRKKKILSLPKT